MSETKQKNKTTPKKRGEKEKPEIREMSIVFPEDNQFTHILKDEGVKGRRIERFLKIAGMKALVKIDFKKNRITLLDTETDIEDRKIQLVAEEIVKKIRSPLQKQFPKIVEAILCEQKEDWLKKILSMIEEGAEVKIERTKGRCVWVSFKKGRSERSLLIE